MHEPKPLNPEKLAGVLRDARSILDHVCSDDDGSPSLQVCMDAEAIRVAEALLAISSTLDELLKPKTIADIEPDQDVLAIVKSDGFTPYKWRHTRMTRGLYQNQGHVYLAFLDPRKLAEEVLKRLPTEKPMNEPA